MPQSVTASTWQTELVNDGRFIRLSFHAETAPNVDVLVPRHAVSELARSLQLLADDTDGRARNTLVQRNQRLTVDGCRLLERNQGALILTVFARMLEQDSEHTVSIPMEMSGTFAQALKEKLERILTTG